MSLYTVRNRSSPSLMASIPCKLELDSPKWLNGRNIEARIRLLIGVLLAISAGRSSGRTSRGFSSFANDGADGRLQRCAQPLGHLAAGQEIASHRSHRN